jgi:multiple sugar transport system substrate-binding protein
MSASDIEGNIVSALHAFGGKLFDEKGNVAVNTPESLEGLTFYTDLLIKDKVMPPGVGGWDSSGNNQAYLSGQAAAVCNTGSIVMAMRKDNPDLLKDTVIGPWPAGWTESGQKTATVPGFGVVIKKKTRYPEHCKQVIRKIMSPERYPGQLQAAGSYWFSALKGYGNIPFFTEDPWNRAIQQDVMPFGRNVEFAGGPNPVFDEIRTAGYLGNMLSRVTVDGWEPQRALDEFDAKAKEIAAKYKNG